MQPVPGADSGAGRCAVRPAVSAARAGRRRAREADEREIEEDDFATAFYENDQIDLGQLMREQFYLAVPMKPLCDAACQGLCPVCGTNLNRGTCDCRRDWDDPRFAVLKTLGIKPDSTTKD